MRAFFNALSPSKQQQQQQQADPATDYAPSPSYTSSSSSTVAVHTPPSSSSSSSAKFNNTNNYNSNYNNNNNSNYNYNSNSYESYNRLYDHLTDSEGIDPSFEEADIVELGLSNEMLSDELYLPSHPTRDWIRCYISSTGPGTYRMYLEGKKRVRFLMSAKHFSTGATFLISINEDFPILETVPRKGYVARLEKQKDLSYLLSLNYCHLCESRLSCFTCGRGINEREVVAKISHYFKNFRPVNLQYRCVNVYIPSLSRNGKRKIWCPRSFKLAYNNTLGPEVDVNTSITSDKNQESYMMFRNKLPEWNEDLNSLVVKFHGNRILTASARNFLLCVNTSETTTTNSIAYFSDEEEEITTSSIGSGKHDGSRQFATIQAIQNSGNKSRRHTESFDSNLTLGQIPNSGAPLAKSRSRSRGNSVGTTPKTAKRKSHSNTSDGSPSTTASNSSSPQLATLKHHPSVGKTIVPAPNYPDDTEPILQFGKCSPTRFTLDFKYPLSPLQAFGIALASFATDEPALANRNLNGQGSPALYYQELMDESDYT